MGRGFLGGRPRLTGVIDTSTTVEVDVRVDVLGFGLVGVRGASGTTCPLNASMREEDRVEGKEGLAGELRVTGLVGVATGTGIEGSNFRLFLEVSGAAISTSSLSRFSAAGGAGALETTPSISGSRATNSTRFLGLSFDGNSRSFFVDTDLEGVFKVDAAVGVFVGDPSSVSREEDAWKTRGLTGDDRRMGLGTISNFRFFEGVSGTAISMSSFSEEYPTNSTRGFCEGAATADWAGARFGVSFDGNSRSCFRGEVRWDGVEAEAVDLVGDVTLAPALSMRV